VEGISDEPWFPDRMTSAFWAIDRGKEPSNLATILLCLPPRCVWLLRQQYTLQLVRGRFRAQLGPCSPTDISKCKGCNTLAFVVESTLLAHGPIHFGERTYKD